MPEYRSPALTQAFSELPQKWYERRSKSNGAFFDLINGLGIFGNILVYRIAGPQETLAPYVVGGIAYLTSTIADGISTSRGLRNFEKAKENNIEVQHREVNSRSRELIAKGKNPYFHPKALVPEAATTITLSAMPINGVIFAAKRAMVAGSNFRLAKRYRRAVEIQQQLTEPPGGNPRD